MSYPLLEPGRRIISVAVVVFAALALGAGEPARGEVSVADEQAEASAVAAQALDAAWLEEAMWRATGRDATIIEPIAWSTQDDAAAWFPVTIEDQNTGAADDAHADLLKLAPSPMRTPNQVMAQQAELIPNEHAVIPLPPAAWTGLAGLASLATIGGRKALIRFFCS